QRHRRTLRTRRVNPETAAGFFLLSSVVGLPFLERDPVPELRIKQAATPVARIGFGMWTSLAVVFRAREYKLLFNSQVSTLNVQRSTLNSRGGSGLNSHGGERSD